MADIVATSTAADDETPFPSGTADDTYMENIYDGTYIKNRH
jgi:hypothetical protein